MEYKLTTFSESETIELAQNLESEKFPNMVICLRGDLGSGKTVFTKGFAISIVMFEGLYIRRITFISHGCLSSGWKSRRLRIRRILQ